jgi:hypothetical protein
MADKPSAKPTALAINDANPIGPVKEKLVFETYVLSVKECFVQAEFCVATDKRSHLARTEDKSGQKTRLVGVPKDSDKLAGKSVDFLSYRIGVIMDKGLTPNANQAWGKDMKFGAVKLNSTYEDTEKGRVIVRVGSKSEFDAWANDPAKREDPADDMVVVVAEWHQGRVLRFMVDGEPFEAETPPQAMGTEPPTDKAYV